MILIFGGTTEGRMAASVATEAGQRFFYSTLDAPGHIKGGEGVELTGGMDATQIAALCRREGIRAIIDAAHPFATTLHTEVARAATLTGVPVIRVERTYPPRRDDVVWCRGWEEALERLTAHAPKRLLVLTGVKTIGRLKPFWQTRPDCRFRILDRESSRSLALSQGVEADQLVYYDPQADEGALLDRLHPDAIITKESGGSGGYEAKVDAAIQRGIEVFVVSRPQLPQADVTVTGPHGLRRALERLAPGFFTLSSGFTTGACATAATKRAMQALLTDHTDREVEFELPDGEWMRMTLESVTRTGPRSAVATAVKDHSDDPDVTRGCRVVCTVELTDGDGIEFCGGEGVGTVTLPGIGIERGEPAINPTPRAMMARELRRLLPRGGVRVTIAVPGGRELAAKTFNPRIGITGGISIIGTSGIVTPFSHKAFVDSIRRSIRVAVSMGVERVVINSGARSERAVRNLYPTLPQQAFIHYGNAIGETIAIASELGVKHLTLSMMIGKAVKLAAGELDTHSHTSRMDTGFISTLAAEAGVETNRLMAIGTMNMATELWTILSHGEMDKMIGLLIDRCRRVCAPLITQGDLTIIILDPDGNPRGDTK